MKASEAYIIANEHKGEGYTIEEILSVIRVASIGKNYSCAVSNPQKGVIAELYELGYSLSKEGEKSLRIRWGGA